MRKIKIAILKILKLVGIFNLTLFFTRKKLRIFCYHGLSYHDEHNFMPGLFISQDTFYHRMLILKKYKINILSLDDAVTKNINKSIKDPSAVLTFDDGFISTFELALPLLEKLKYKSTIYITSYYQKHQNPIFRLAIRYLFWKKKPNQDLINNLNLPLNNPKEWDIIQYGEQTLKEKDRMILIETVKEKFNIHLPKELESKFMKLASDETIRQAFNNGVDIQLHTHRHRLPLDKSLSTKEIIENRDHLKELIGINLEHFCYPSGLWSEEHLPVLRDLGIKSATTCDPSLVTPDTEPLAYPRFLDSDEKEMIEFEADLCGVTHYILKIKRLLGMNTQTTTY